MYDKVDFEVSADDPMRAIAFYGRVFGWRGERLTEPQEAWLIRPGAADGPGGGAGLVRRGGRAGFVDTMEVGSLEAMAADVEAQGGRLVVPKMPVPGVGWLAYFRDPDGNVFGLTQRDPGAR